MSTVQPDTSVAKQGRGCCGTIGLAAIGLLLISALIGAVTSVTAPASSEARATITIVPVMAVASITPGGAQVTPTTASAPPVIVYTTRIIRFRTSPEKNDPPTGTGNGIGLLNSCAQLEVVSDQGEWLEVRVTSDDIDSLVPGGASLGETSFVWQEYTSSNAPNGCVAAEEAQAVATDGSASQLGAPTVVYVIKMMHFRSSPEALDTTLERANSLGILYECATLDVVSDQGDWWEVVADDGDITLRWDKKEALPASVYIEKKFTSDDKPARCDQVTATPEPTATREPYDDGGYAPSGYLWWATDPTDSVFVISLLHDGMPSSDEQLAQWWSNGTACLAAPGDRYSVLRGVDAPWFTYAIEVTSGACQGFNGFVPFEAAHANPPPP